MVLLTTYYLSLTTCNAAFKDSGWGVRPIGMGGAFTAIADDSNAALYNPGGLAQITRPETSLMSSRLFAGLESVDIGLNYFSYIHPLGAKIGTTGITWASLFSPGLYREDTFTVTYGRFLGNVKGVSLAVGGNVKYLRTDYNLDARTVDDPVFASGSSKSVITFDVGALLSSSRTGLSLGVASKNITRPNIGLKTDDYVENENVIGVAYYNRLSPYLNLPYFTASFDYVSRGKDVDYRLGAESWLFDGKFAVRVGARSSEVSFGLGYEVGVWSNVLIMDYAFGWPLEIEETIGSHRMGLTLKF